MERTIHCKWDLREIALGVDENGRGPSVVLLPTTEKAIEAARGRGAEAKPA